MVKNPPVDAGDPGSIPGLGRSPGVGNGNPCQCSCLENPMGRGAWWATLHVVSEPDTTERASTLESVSQSVQSLSCVQLFATPWIEARQASLSITNSWSLLKLVPVELVMPLDHAKTSQSCALDLAASLHIRNVPPLLFLLRVLSGDM